METKLIGRYIVSDPKICHGKPTFRGTRIFVADVLEQVADGTTVLRKKLLLKLYKYGKMGIC